MNTLERTLGIVGWKNAGKTGLVADLVRELTAFGYRVSTVKHAHHGFDMDRPGKDSHTHREAGAREVLVASDRRWALLHELEETGPLDLGELVTHLSPADLILAEGFKAGPHAKIEVWRDPAQPILALDDSTVVALVCPDPAHVPPLACPVFARDDLDALLAFVRRWIASRAT